MRALQTEAPMLGPQGVCFKEKLAVHFFMFKNDLIVKRINVTPQFWKHVPVSEVVFNLILPMKIYHHIQEVDLN